LLNITAIVVSDEFVQLEENEGKEKEKLERREEKEKVEQEVEWTQWRETSRRLDSGYRSTCLKTQRSDGDANRRQRRTKSTRIIDAKQRARAPLMI
jgi:hypothetical protein